MELVANPALGRQILEQLVLEYHIDKPLPHLTELIYCLTKSFWDRKDPLPPTEQEILLFSTGWGLERLLLKHQKEAHEGEVDGIHFTPDFLAFTDIHGELKTTRQSSKKYDEIGAGALPIGWQRQILGYMHCLNTTEYELAVLHLMGEYRPPFPTIRTWRVSASQFEIEDNWEWLQTRRGHYLDCLDSNMVPVPYSHNEKYECTHCKYKLRCDTKEV